MPTHTPTQESPPAAGPVRAFSLAEHARLERCFEAVLAAFEGDDRLELARRWTDLERQLLDHMALEEQSVLARFAEVDPVEAAALRQDHDVIRRDLEELGVCVDLHVLTPALAGRFIAHLRGHAFREDALLYRWAAAHPEGR